MEIAWYWLIPAIIVSLVVGFVIGLFVMRAIFNKQLKDNPPVNRNMIRAMFMQMGRKPSEKDITRVLEAMDQYKTDKKPAKPAKAEKAPKAAKKASK